MSWNVLLVEADVAVAEEIRAAFGPAGFVVSTTEAGESALERTRADVIVAVHRDRLRKALMEHGKSFITKEKPDEQ